MKPIYSGTARGWVLDAHHLADVAALLEHCGYRVAVRYLDEAA